MEYVFVFNEKGRICAEITVSCARNKGTRDNNRLLVSAVFMQIEDFPVRLQTRKQWKMKIRWMNCRPFKYSGSRWKIFNGMSKTLRFPVCVQKLILLRRGSTLDAACFIAEIVGSERIMDFPRAKNPSGNLLNEQKYYELCVYIFTEDTSWYVDRPTNQSIGQHEVSRMKNVEIIAREQEIIRKYMKRKRRAFSLSSPPPLSAFFSLPCHRYPTLHRTRLSMRAYDRSRPRPF